MRVVNPGGCDGGFVLARHRGRGGGLTRGGELFLGATEEGRRRLHVPKKTNPRPREGFLLLLACGRGTEEWGAAPRFHLLSVALYPAIPSMCKADWENNHNYRGKFEFRTNRQPGQVVTEDGRGAASSAPLPTVSGCRRPSPSHASRELVLHQTGRMRSSRRFVGIIQPRLVPYFNCPQK